MKSMGVIGANTGDSLFVSIITFSITWVYSGDKDHKYLRTESMHLWTRDIGYHIERYHEKQEYTNI